MTKILGGLAGILVLSITQIATATWLAETAYGRRANFEQVRALVSNSNLPAVVSEMQAHSLQIFKVRIPEHERMKQNHFFDFLPDIPAEKYPELRAEADDVGSASAVFITQNSVVGSSSNFILIAEDALPMTIFHEFCHHLFEVQNHLATEKITEIQIENQKLNRRFDFKTRKVMLDNGLLVSKLWREEIKELIEDMTGSISAGKNDFIMAAEEIAVELNLLKILAEKKSGYMNRERAEQGINGYASGLLSRSQGVVRNTMSLADLITTEGLNQDPAATNEEKLDWKVRQKVVEQKLNAFLRGTWARMRSQVDEAQAILSRGRL